MVTVASWSDLRHHRIPNWLSLGGLATGLLLQVLTAGVTGLLSGLEGAGLALVLFLPAWLLRGMGAGDVKLMMTVGAFLGPRLVLVAAALTLIAGGVLAVAVLVSRGGFRPVLARYGSTLKCLLVTGNLGYVPPLPTEAAAARFPYAAAIACGTLLALWWSAGTAGA